MKLNKTYSYIMVCPKTGSSLTGRQVLLGVGGVCPHCGDGDEATYTHYKKIIGKWECPSLFEIMFKGYEPIFHTKEYLDSLGDTNEAVH